MAYKIYFLKFSNHMHQIPAAAAMTVKTIAITFSSINNFLSCKLFR